MRNVIARSPLWIARVFSGIVLFCVLANASDAQEAGAVNPGGGIFVPVEDGWPHQCVNVNESLLSLYVVAVKEVQTSGGLWGLFAKSKSLGAKFDLTVAGPRSMQDPAFSFPRAKALQPIGNTHIVTLPMIYPLVTFFPLLSQEGEPYSNIGFDVELINTEKDTPLAATIKSLIKMSDNLPVPPNPYVTGVQYFGKFVNSLIEQESADSQDVAPVAAMYWDLWRGGSKPCGPRDLREGTYALIFDYDGHDVDNVVSTASAAEKYCFFYDEASHSVTYAARDGDCSKTKGIKSALNNPQLVYQATTHARSESASVVRASPTQTANIMSAPSDKDLAFWESKLMNDKNIQSAQIATPRPDFKVSAEKLTAAIQKRETLSDPLKELGALPVIDPTPEKTVKYYKLSQSLGAEFDSVKALSRCRTIGVPAESCF